MRLGFIGTGEITASIVTGLRFSGVAAHPIWLSPRNSAVATQLANRFGEIYIASSNQDVLDHSDIILVAVRPPVAQAVLSELRFRNHHQVISLVSGLSLAKLSELVTTAGRLTRAVPLPSSSKRLSPTAIFPPGDAALDLFSNLGTVFPVENEREFEAMCAATATIASYLAFIKQIASWLAHQGVPESKARAYITRLFLGVTTTAADSAASGLQSLAANHATPGGINEQFLKHLMEHGFLTNVSEGLDAILRRIS